MASSVEPIPRRSLIVGNTRTVEMVGELAELSALARQSGGCAAFRLLWFARPGDIVVLPGHPRAEYLDYVTGITGVDPSDLLVMVPPPGALGADLLTPDRTADPGFRHQLAEAVRRRSVDQVLAVFKDVALAQLADSVGLALPGQAFSAQGGDSILNSKAGFRAIAAGAGTPIVPGAVVRSPAEATTVAGELLAAGHSVIVKQEFASGAQGNELLSQAPVGRMAGAVRSVVVNRAAQLAEYFIGNWDRLTAGNRHRLVIERYLTDCDTVYAEYWIGDLDCELLGVAEILMDPFPVGEVVPGKAGEPATRQALLAAGSTLCRAVHAMGYRGYLSMDSVRTPAGEVYATETNARMSGSTHLHQVISARLLAAGQRRVLLEMHDWRVPSFAAAAERLAEAGLAFSRDRGVGVLLTTDLMPDSTLTYCVVAADLPAAQAVRDQLDEMFSTANSGTVDR
jgi:hypothetical protein